VDAPASSGTLIDSSPTPPSVAPSSQRRGRRRPAWFAPILIVIVLGLIGALLVLGDTLGRRWAEGMIADRVQTSLGLDVPPQVTVDGVPFLTQVAAQRLDAVHVTAPVTTVQVDGHAVSLSDVDLWLRGVTQQDNFATITVADLQGQGRLAWASVAAITGTEISYSGTDDAGRGRVALRHDLEFQGLTVPITLTGRPVIDPDTHQLSFAEPTVAVAGFTLPADLVAGLLAQNLKPIDLPLPDGLTVTEVTAGTEGLAVVLAGTDVSFTTT